MSAISDAVSELERITGLSIVVHACRDGDDGFAVNGYLADVATEQAVASVWHMDLGEAVHHFLRRNLHRVRLDIMDEQNGRCAICQRAVPLQLHHKVFRSERRDDRRSNLHLLCQSCHDGSHGKS